MQVRIWRFIALIVLSFSAGIRAWAQDNYFIEDPKVFTGGLILGANFTQVDGDTYYGYNKVGVDAGGTVYIRFSQTTGVSMELLYSQKGSRGEDVMGSATLGTYVQKYFMNLNYVEVPVTFHVKAYGFDGETGLSYAYLVKSSEWVQADVPVVITQQANSFNTTDLEYIVGLMHKVYKHLYVNGRFQYSIIDMRPTDRVPLGFSYGNAGQFNNMFSLRFIYYF